MSLTATAVIQSDISFTLVDNTNSSQSESSSLNYTRNLSNGTGVLQCNYGVIQSGVLPSGGDQFFDFTALEKNVLNLNANVNFSRIKGIIVENRSTTLGYDINIHATGANAFDEIFNGESGNVLVKPYGSYIYTDAINGAVVDSSNRHLTLNDVSGSGANWTLVVVGVTG